ncbi:CMRF35-like molecule 7 [Erethizon dorsatum]
MWLPPVLLLLSLPGCFSLQGPKSVRGSEGGSVTVQCRYHPRWKTYNKWWCRGARRRVCKILVKTRGSEQEEKSGRVSIRDNQRDGLFKVTMEGLRQDDADTYWCGIETAFTDPGAQVKVTIDPEEPPRGSRVLLLLLLVPENEPSLLLPSLLELSHPQPHIHVADMGAITMSSKPLDGPSDETSVSMSSGFYKSTCYSQSESPTPIVHLMSPHPPSPHLALARKAFCRTLLSKHHHPFGGQQKSTGGILGAKGDKWQRTGCDRGAPGSDGSSSHRTHYLLLVFVKVPILLILAGAVLWLKGSQKVPEEQWGHPICENLNSELLTEDMTP